MKNMKNYWRVMLKNLLKSDNLKDKIIVKEVKVKVKIREIKELKSIENEKISLNLEERILSINFNNIIKLQCIRNIFLGRKGNVHIISEDNKFITLVNIISWNTDEFLTLFLRFEYVYIGSNVEEKINSINRYIVTFENLNMIKVSKNFEHNNYKCRLENNFIQLTNKSKKCNSKEFLEEFFIIYEVICLLIGYFPKIQKVELDCEDSIIEEYSDLVYLYNSSSDIIHNKFSLVDINNLNGLGRLIYRWKTLKSKLGDYPIWGLFVSQMNDNHYLDYMLGILLQSIDGYCEIKLKKELLKKSEKDKKIIKYLVDNIMKYDSISNSDKKKVCKFLKDYHNPCFENYLRKLISNNKKYSDKIFYEEIYLDKLYENQTECNLYVGKNSFLTKSINERRKISHMSKKDNTFNDFQILIAYYKWLLMYRVVLIKNIFLILYDFMLDKCISRIRWINKKYNTDKCSTCKYNADCKIK